MEEGSSSVGGEGQSEEQFAGKEVTKWPEEIYTFREAAARLRCSYHKIWRLVHTGKIKQCTYMSGRIPAAEILRLLGGE